MNNHFFVTVSGHYTIAPQEIEETLKKAFQSCDVCVEDFEKSEINGRR